MCHTPTFSSTSPRPAISYSRPYPWVVLCWSIAPGVSHEARLSSLHTVRSCFSVLSPRPYRLTNLCSDVVPAYRCHHRHGAGPKRCAHHISIACFVVNPHVLLVARDQVWFNASFQVSFSCIPKKQLSLFDTGTTCIISNLSIPTRTPRRGL